MPNLIANQEGSLALRMPKSCMAIFLADGSSIITTGYSGTYFPGWLQPGNDCTVDSALKFTKNKWNLSPVSLQNSDPDPGSHSEILPVFIEPTNASIKEYWVSSYQHSPIRSPTRSLPKAVKHFAKNQMFSDRTWLKKHNGFCFLWYSNIMFRAPPAGREATVSIHEHQLAEQNFYPSHLGRLSSKSSFTLHAESWGEHEPHPSLLAVGTAAYAGTLVG